MIVMKTEEIINNLRTLYNNSNLWNEELRSALYQAIFLIESIHKKNNQKITQSTLRWQEKS